MAEQVDRIDFYLDPMCPWAYQTSKWIREVRKHTGLGIDWRFFSLEEINRTDGKKHPWEREWSYGWSQMRVGAYLRRQSGDAVDQWYAAIGQAFHEEGRPTHDPDVHQEILSGIGFEDDVVQAAIADPTTSDEVRADHDHVVDRYAAFGVPVLVFPNDHPLFGPVVVPAPTGDEAVRLWELTVGWTEFPHLYELRKPKTDDDLRHIGEAFDPYLRAREWNTIENPAP